MLTLVTSPLQPVVVASILSPFQFHLILFGVATLVAIVSLWWILRNRSKQAATEFAVFLGTVVVWGCLQLVEIASGPTVAYYTSFLLEGMRTLMAVSWLYFTLTYAGYQATLHSTTARFAVAIGTLYLLVFTAIPQVATTFTFDTVQVIREPFTVVLLDGQTLYHVLAMVVGYSFVVIGTLVLAYRFISTRYTRPWQTIVFLVSVITVILFDGLLLNVIAPVPGIDYSVLGTALGSVIFILALYRGDLFGFVPVARNQLFHTIDDGVLVLNPAHTIIDANSTASSILGTDIPIGASADDVLPAAIASDERVQTMASGRTTITLQTDESESIYDMTVSPLTGSGQSGGVVITLRDITAHKQREQALQRYETLVEASGDPQFTLDAEGRLTFVNEAFVELTGYDRDTLLGSHASIFTTEADIAQGERIIRSLITSSTERETFEIDVVTADGERIPCENHVALLPFDEEFSGTVGVLRDISERKHRERELQRQNERLDQFASLVSHDLRNPLSVASGQLELARQECDSAHLDSVVQAHERMETLIDGLLTLARSGETVGDFEAIDLGNLSQKCWQTVATHDATVEIETTQTVCADSDRLRQLLENLFRNAVEHAGERVTVTVGACEGGFFVADDGPGIPTDEREQIFESGYTSDTDGTGLGLAIVNEIVEAHEWEIDITESSNGGARFEITGVELVA